MELYLSYNSSTARTTDKLGILFHAMIRKMAVLFAAAPKKVAPKEVSRAAIDHQAEQIMNIYGNNILRFAYSYLHSMSDAEEVLQDTLVQFLKAAPAFESEQHGKAWLLRVASNLSKNRLAYNKVRMTDELNDELTANSRADLSFVWEAVKDLPDDLRETIHLYYYEGYSTKQIANILQKNEATVRTHLRRGRAKLREILKEAYDFEETI